MGYFNGYDANHRGYAVSGTTKDFFYGEFGVPGYTVELGTAFFESCSNFENVIWPDNIPTLTYAAKASRFSYITPAGPDAVDISLSSSAVSPGDPVAISAIINDTRFNNSQGTEPVQNIIAAEYYIDVPPWVTDTVPLSLPMAPTDGSFDSPQEGVEASIDTSSLAQGRHLVYVRGQDADGNWGAFSSAFLFIIDPAAAPRIQGQVVAADGGQGLAATVSAGSFFQTTTDPSGYYEMRVISGTYNLTAVPVSQDYASSSVTGIEAHDYETVVQDFSLFPYCPIFEDDVESGNMGWTAEAPWAITDEASHSPLNSWTDSPGGSYPNNQDTSLSSPVFDLSEYEGVALSYWQICNTESGYDYCQVEASTDGGATWGAVAQFDGLGTQWEEISLPLSELDNQANAMIRFRLVSDGSIVKDGWHIDDISLLGAGPVCLIETEPAASFESSSPDPLGTTTIFTNTSTGGGLGSEWDFGDGSPLSSTSHPSHLYTLTGTYTVTLTVTNSLGSDVVIGLVEILESDSVHGIFLPLLVRDHLEAVKP
jgi:carboxypeptidase T